MQIAPSAVRWYADQGLLPCERVAGNQRRFFADVSCRVAMIRAAQEVGLTLHEIREALRALPEKQAPTRQDWEFLAAQLRSTLTARIDELFTLLDEMTGDDSGTIHGEGVSATRTNGLEPSPHETERQAMAPRR